MNPNSSDCFYLIKSLDKLEKAHLTKKIERNFRSSFYKDYFSICCNSQNSDEPLLSPGQVELSRTQLKSQKQNLTFFILKELEVFHGDSTLENKLSSSLFQVSYFRLKNQYQKALSICGKALMLSVKYGAILKAIQLLTEEQHIIVESGNAIGTGRPWKGKGTELEYFMEQFLLLNTYQGYITELHKIRNLFGSYPDEEKNKRVVQVMELTANQATNTPAREEIVKLEEEFIFYFGNLLINEYEEAKRHFYRFLTAYELVFDKHEFREKYLWHLNFGLGIAVHLGERQMVNLVMKRVDAHEKFLNGKAKSLYFKREVWLIQIRLMAFYVHVHEFPSACAIGKLINKEINNGFVSPSTKKVFLANYCQSLCCIGEVKQALVYYNNLVNDKALHKIRKDINPTIRVWGMVIFYELFSYQNVVSLIREVKRKKHFYSDCKAYNSIVRFFSDLIRIEDKNTVLTLVEELITELQSISESDAQSKFLLENMMMKAWLSRKRELLAHNHEPFI